MEPSGGVLLLWTLLASPLTLAGLVLFGGVLALRQGGETTISVGVVAIVALAPLGLPRPAPASRTPAPVCAFTPPSSL